MTLGLDLSSSEAKVARARFHFEALECEMRRLYEKGNPYTVRVSKIDKQGWCSAFLRANDISEYNFGAIVGDLIHNLRSALNYIVTALVDRSGATLNVRHQFPIYSTQAGYEERVGTQTSAKAGGRLGGVSHGLAEVWRLQPFHRKPSPENDPLMAINWLSNADKHRAIPAYIPLVIGGEGEWVPALGHIIGVKKLPPLPDWEPDQELEVGRVQIIGAFGAKPGYNAKVTVGVNFGTPAFAGQHPAFAIDAVALKVFCNHVAMIVDLFKAL